MSILMKNNNIFCLFLLSILMCDLYTGYTILPDFRTKVGGATYTRVITVHCTKILRIIIDDKLKWANHISYIKI